MTTTLARITDRSAVVGIIGQGYVGLPLALVFEEAGFRVRGFDLDPKKVDALTRGESYIRHIGSDRVAAAIGRGRFSVTTNFDQLADCDAILICVPTPLGTHREPDLSYIHNTAREIAKRLRKGQLVVLESTTYPGTTDEEVLPILEATGLTCPDDFLLAFSPEREDPGNINFETSTIPKVVGGDGAAALEAAVALYAAAVVKVVPVSSPDAAEAVKITENIFRAVNIALVNELKPVLAAMGIDIWKVIDAAATKPFGYQPFYPGPGLGGHCIPIDPFYLTWRAREFGQATRFIELAGEINSRMPHLVVEAVARALGEDGKTAKGAGILIIGLAYKPNIDDIRESPSAEIITLLGGLGARISYHDPHIAKFPRMRKYRHDLTSVHLTREVVASADCVVIVTNHSAIDYALLGDHARLIVDTRNAMARVVNPKARIVRA